MKLRVRCESCEFWEEVEPGFVNCLAEGIQETRCNCCNQTHLIFELQFKDGGEWYHLKTKGE